MAEAQDDSHDAKGTCSSSVTIEHVCSHNFFRNVNTGALHLMLAEVGCQVTVF